DEADPPLLHGLERVLLALHPDPTRGRLLEACDHPEHGALARTARSEERGDAPRLGGERHVLHRLELAEPLPQVLDADGRARHVLCARHVRCILSCRRLKISIKTRRTIDTSASVRATTDPWSSWNWSNARSTYSVAVSVWPVS